MLELVRLRKVAITGGLSCGKSSVCRILSELGAYVVSADKVVHQLLSSDTTLGHQVVELLGPEILVNQTIDRSRISRIVFRNMDLLRAFEQLVHPAVYREIDKEYQEQLNHPFPPPLFAAEIPLLFESGGKRDYDAVVAVIAKRDDCCKRFIEATGHDEAEFNDRMARQFSPQEKAKRADYVIYNDGSIDDLREATRELFRKLIEV